jgi:hypothetical protein
VDHENRRTFSKARILDGPECSFDDCASGQRTLPLKSHRRAVREIADRQKGYQDRYVDDYANTRRGPPRETNRERYEN